MSVTGRAEESSLSSWAGPYVTQMLGKGAALANLPYTAYEGPLSAGPSSLQTKAFQGLGALQVPNASSMQYNPRSFTGAAYAPPGMTQPLSGGPVGNFAMPVRGAPDATRLPDFTMPMGDADGPVGGGANLMPVYGAPSTGPAREVLDYLTMPGTPLLSTQSPEGQMQPEQRYSMYQGDGRPNLMPMPTPGGGFEQPPMLEGRTPASGNVVQEYMTPYLQAALDPQYAAARRQSEIQAQQLQSQFGKAGAYGGSRQGVAEAELQRGLLDRMSDITGRGYNEAFTQAQNQFNTEENRRMQAAQQASRLGLDVLGAQRTGGAEERAIEQSGIAADMAQFEFERDYPQRQVQFMQSLLQGLPLETQAYNYTSTSPLQNIASGGADILSTLRALGLIAPAD